MHARYQPDHFDRLRAAGLRRRLLSVRRRACRRDSRAAERADAAACAVELVSSDVASRLFFAEPVERRPPKCIEQPTVPTGPAYLPTA